MKLWISVLTCRGGEPYLPKTVASIRAEWNGPIHLCYAIPGPPTNLLEVEHFYNPEIHKIDQPDPRVDPESMQPIMTRRRVGLGHQRAIQVALDSLTPWTHFLMIEDDARLVNGWNESLHHFEREITKNFGDRWALWIRKHPDVGWKSIKRIQGIGEMNPRREPLIGNVAVLYSREVITQLVPFIDRRMLNHYHGPLDMQTRYLFMEQCYRAFLTEDNLANHHGTYSRRNRRKRSENFL